MKVQKPVISDHGWNSGTMGVSRYRRRSNLTIAVILVLGAIAASGIVLLVLLLFSSGPAPRTEPAPTPRDPYAVYLENAPAGAPQLSREDAQARAYLGCGQTFAPGTVDAVLAQAYAGICPK